MQTFPVCVQIYRKLIELRDRLSRECDVLQRQYSRDLAREDHNEGGDIAAKCFLLRQVRQLIEAAMPQEHVPCDFVRLGVIIVVRRIDQPSVRNILLVVPSGCASMKNLVSADAPLVQQMMKERLTAGDEAGNFIIESIHGNLEDLPEAEGLIAA